MPGVGARGHNLEHLQKVGFLRKIFLEVYILATTHQKALGGAVVRASDFGPRVPGSNPGRCTFRCGLEQATFTLLSTG